MNIAIEQVIIPTYHRQIKPWSLQRIVQSMQDHGYNLAYPIVLDGDSILVDGRHRLEAARICGLEEVPYTHKPKKTSAIRFGLQCNADGQLCEADDVFDLAELCWGLAQDGWTGQQIAEELGWSVDLVSKHKLIKDRLHPYAWDLAHSTNSHGIVEVALDSIVESQSTIVDWSESHFRALLKHLAWDRDKPDRAIMRAQIAAVRKIMEMFQAYERGTSGDKKNVTRVTAKAIGELAECHAWHAQLKIYMRDGLAEQVPLADRKQLLRSINRNVFGKKPSDEDLDRFQNAVAAINERVLGVTLYYDDALQRVPLLENDSISLVVNDPPYNVTDNDWDKIGTDEEYLNWIQEWLDILRPKLRERYHLFLFCSPEYQASIEMLLKSSGWPLQSRVVWAHRNLVSGREIKDRFASTWEMVFHCGTHALNWSPDWNDGRFDVQQYARPQNGYEDEPYHPTAKPLALIRHFVEVGSKPGDIVLDMFAGGGTTGQASKEAGQRRCILIEASDDYCTEIEKRLQIKRHEEVVDAGN